MVAGLDGPRRARLQDTIGLAPAKKPDEPVLLRLMRQFADVIDFYSHNRDHDAEEVARGLVENGEFLNEIIGQVRTTPREAFGRGVRLPIAFPAAKAIARSWPDSGLDAEDLSQFGHWKLCLTLAESTRPAEAAEAHRAGVVAGGSPVLDPQSWIAATMRNAAQEASRRASELRDLARRGQLDTSPARGTPLGGEVELLAELLTRLRENVALLVRGDYGRRIWPLARTVASPAQQYAIAELLLDCAAEVEALLQTLEWFAELPGGKGKEVVRLSTRKQRASKGRPVLETLDPDVFPPGEPAVADDREIARRCDIRGASADNTVAVHRQHALKRARERGPQVARIVRHYFFGGPPT